MNLTFLWLIIGTILILSEFIVPGFVICFFGVSAIVTGVLYWFVPGLSLSWQIMLFAILGVVLLIGCRRFMPGVFKGKENNFDDDIDSDNSKLNYEQ